MHILVSFVGDIIRGDDDIVVNCADNLGRVDVLWSAEIPRMPFVMQLKQHCCMVWKAHQ